MRTPASVAERDTAYLLVHPYFPYYMNEPAPRCKRERYLQHIDSILKGPSTKVVLEDGCCMLPFTEMCSCLSCELRRSQGITEYQTQQHLAQLSCGGNVIVVPTQSMAPWPLNGDEQIIDALKDYKTVVVVGALLAKDVGGDFDGCVGFAYNYYRCLLPLQLDEENSWKDWGYAETKTRSAQHPA